MGGDVTWRDVPETGGAAPLPCRITGQAGAEQRQAVSRTRGAEPVPRRRRQRERRERIVERAKSERRASDGRASMVAAGSRAARAGRKGSGAAVVVGGEGGSCLRTRVEGMAREGGMGGG